MAAKKRDGALLPAVQVEAEAAKRIFAIRGARVVLDSDLAEFYGVETKSLNLQVTRNPGRFPEDFCFRLTSHEYAALRSQNETSNAGRGGRRYPPRVFTEQGALQVAGVLKSPRAAEVSVAVARAFVAMRDQLAELHEHPVVRQLLADMERLNADAARQHQFNAGVLEALAELRPILDAVNAAEPA